MGQEEVGVRAVENDDVELGVLLDQADKLGQFGDGRCRDRVDRRMVERHPAVRRTHTIDAQMSPRLRPRGGTATV
jgi:hypothetical protein